jgi:hypothetical protein
MDLGKKKIPKQKIALDPIENYIDLQAMVEYRGNGQTVGAYLLRKNARSPWHLVFTFRCQGAHSNLSEGQIEGFVDKLEQGLKDLSFDATVTFRLKAYKTDTARQKSLKHLVDRAPTGETKFLIIAEQQRTRELKKAGRREPKELTVSVTIPLADSEQEPENWRERALKPIEDLLSRAQGVSPKTTRLENALKAGLERYKDWETALVNKLGLSIVPLAAGELWEDIWYRLNPNMLAIQIPQLIVVDEDELEEIVTSDRPCATLLFAESVPVPDRQWVYSGGKFTATLFFADKPAGWKDKRHQLTYLWEMIARDAVTDTEIFCQISRANPMLVQTAMRRLTKQSTVAASIASERRDVDVRATKKAREAETAQESLYEGAAPYHTGIVFLIHRDSQEELNEACRYLESLFNRPAWVDREQDIAWKVWLQTLPVCTEKLLASPFNRRLIYLSTELPGLIPAITTRSPDRDGLELIAEDGGSPVHLDLFQPEGKHLAVFGTTRSGKSVLVAGILVQALARSVPVVAIDYPKPDGTSTFTDFAKFVKPLGAYFDVGAEAINLFERPDLSALTEEERKRRFEDFKDFLCGCLLAMVVGVNTEETLKTTIRTVLYCVLNGFFADPTILDRYDHAEVAGFGSADWQKIPTLRDYLAFCTQKEVERFLQFEEGVQLYLLPRALEQISLRLTYWANSRVGKAIASPSSVPTDSMLLVFALRQVSQDEDAAILSLVAYAAALRRAMSFPMSIFFIDESPVLFQFLEIAQLVAMLCANGAKAGIRVILTAQDPNTIARTKVASQIFQNLSTRLIGRVQRNAIASFQEIFHYPPDIIGQCENFLPNKRGVFTQWLLDDSTHHTVCRYYPSYALLGVVANNPDEQQIRTEFLERYPDKYEAIVKFSNLLRRSLGSQISLRELLEADERGTNHSQ